MRLYDDPCSGNGYKVRLILALLGQKYDYVPLDILKAETRTPEFLAKNPNGRVPPLELDDGTFWPSPTRSCTTWPTARRFLPHDRLVRAQVLQWLFFEQYSHEPYIAMVRFSTISCRRTPAARRLPRWSEGGPRGAGRDGTPA